MARIIKVSYDYHPETTKAEEYWVMKVVVRKGDHNINYVIENPEEDVMDWVYRRFQMGAVEIEDLNLELEIVSPPKSSVQLDVLTGKPLTEGQQ